jgi:hypothetical protein
MFLSTTARCQKSFWCESFDFINVPHLPPGWESSRSEIPPIPDATTSSSIPHSAPNTVIMANSKKSQWFLSPSIDCSKSSLIRLEFFDRRSATFTSDIIVEILPDNENTFIQVGDTLRGGTFSIYVKHCIDFKLDREIQKIRIRWRCAGNGIGPTATYRLDDIALFSISTVDIGVCRLVVTPRFPKRNESVTVTGSVMNYGTIASGDIHITMACDSNGDSLVMENEIVLQRTTSNLAASDSFTVLLVLDSLEIRSYRFVLIVSSDEDDNHANDTLWCVCYVSPGTNSIIINEIMPDPHPGEPEWLELFLSGEETIGLADYIIENRHTKISFKEYHRIDSVHGREYIIVTRDTVTLKKFYALPGRVCIQLPLPEHFFTNTEGQVLLRDPNGRTTDSVFYGSGWGQGRGVSLERINPFRAPDSSNWSSSHDPEGGSPWERNSISQKDKDIGIENFYSEISGTGSGMMVYFRGTLVNRGLYDVDNITIRFYEDSNSDSLLSSDEYLISHHVERLSVGMVQDIQFGPIYKKSGIRRYALTVSYPGSEDMAPDIFWNTFTSAYPQNILVINEIMFSPHEGEAEYIEVFNTSDQDIELGGWMISDVASSGRSTNRTFTIPISKVISSKGFFVIISDSSFFSTYGISREELSVAGESHVLLNNDGDNIVLMDPSSARIDSVRFSPLWHHPDQTVTRGIALERIHPLKSGLDRYNWTSSTAPTGGTPGRQNSVYLVSEPQSSVVSISPNPFSPDGDGIEDEATISVEFPSRTVTLRVRIFDSIGRLVKTLEEGSPVGSRYTVRWDGMSNSSQQCRIGLYVVYIEAVDRDGGVAYTLKQPLVLARRF